MEGENSSAIGVDERKLYYKEDEPPAITDKSSSIVVALYER